MAKGYLYRLADRFESKLKREAMGLIPKSEEEQALGYIKNIFSSNSSNAALAGCIGIGPQVQLGKTPNNGPKTVYFQVVCDPKQYETVLPRRTEISNLLKPIVENQLKAFMGGTWSATVGIVPKM